VQKMSSTDKSFGKIVILSRADDAYANAIVTAAMERSFTASQLETADYDHFNGKSRAAVLINPTDADLPLLTHVLEFHGKALVLGRLGRAVAERVGLRVHEDVKPDPSWSHVGIDNAEPFNASSAVIRYVQEHALGRAAAMETRPLVRYDFVDEWNNLGYGSIPCDGNSWSLACTVDCPEAVCIGSIESADGRALSAYATVTDSERGSALWVNRAVGPVDSMEWRILEEFWGNYRSEELPCYPYLNEIPLGYQGAVTMRLDCDQGVESAKPLFDLYSSMGLPFSVALLTGLHVGEADLRLLREIIGRGGAVLSHSVNHYPNWGGSYGAALEEAVESKAWIQKNLPGTGSGLYAVSPFHQNPPYAVNALADGGYEGFVAGTIHNDPEFLLGRAGRVPLAKKSIVSHSQQCMLHGDCYHRYGRSLGPYYESFSLRLRAGAIFGYLDHPFGPEYTYGWDSESERLQVHEQFLQHLLAIDGLWWCSLAECLGFLVQRDSAKLWVADSGEVMFVYDRGRSAKVPSASWRGMVFAPK
jgi:hypothetical protein